MPWFIVRAIDQIGIDLHLWGHDSRIDLDTKQGAFVTITESPREILSSLGSVNYAFSVQLKDVMAAGKPLYKEPTCPMQGKYFSATNKSTTIIFSIKSQVLPRNSKPALIMKSPFYILTALLPIAAVAVPTAEAADDSLEERGNGGGGGGHRWGNDGDHDRDPCVVKKTYWYHKYPCVSSETVGESKVGDKFQPVCKYQ